MKKLFIRLLSWLRIKKRPYGFKQYSFKPKDVKWPNPKSSDGLLSNFAMLIPTEAYKPEKLEMDERGAPIFAGCKAGEGGCACTGACQKVVGWTKDPEKVEAYRKHIEMWNEVSAKGLVSEFYRNDNGELIWSHAKDKKQ